jgi:HD-GYP domain-containing protein (c-di-GMP phosphodiesterase class II)
MRRQLQSLLPRMHNNALLFGALAILALSIAWAALVPTVSWRYIDSSVAWLLFLIAAVVIADRYPIHVQRHTKVSIISVPLYLLAVLFPPLSAVCAVGVGVLIAELIARHERASQPLDIVLTTGRWSMVAMLGTWIAHTPPSIGIPHGLLLFITAGAISAGDLLLGSLHIASISKEPFLRTLLATARAAGAAESIQYLLGILGALAAEQHTWAVVLLIIPCTIVYLAFKRSKELQNSTRWILESMADAVDLRDPYTGGHSRRVAHYCAGIFRQLALVGPEVDLIIAAARVHDIGKIGVPDHVLNKPGPLTPEERVIMETHPDRGADLLLRYPDFARGVGIVRHHHESWNGKGYPSKLAGYAIPFGARVIAVADSYDAMTSDRPYRRGMTPARAAQILREGRGEQWDPTVVEAFLHSIADQLEAPCPEPLPPAALPSHDLVHVETML